MFSFICSFVLGSVAIVMFARARFEFTKTVALVPAAMALTELFFASVLEPAMFPVLTVLLTAFRVAAAGFGLFVLREDAKMAARRSEKRRRCARQVLCASHGIQPVTTEKSQNIRVFEAA